MKTVTTATSNKLKQSYDVQTSLRLIAEWNMNRYSPISVVRNTAAALEDGDPDLFPIDSIVLPERPTAGILKNRANSANRMGYKPDGYVTTGYVNKPNGPRYFTATPESKYKYWSSPSESSGTVVGPSASTMSNCQPTVIYAGNTWSNKIVVGIENSYSKPTAWTVETSVDGTNWVTVATNPAIPTNGRVELYRQVDGTWSSAPYYSNPTQLKGVRITVTQMDQSKVYFNLIELGLRLVSDLSSYLISFDSEATMANPSFITPLGTASANTASVVLANFDNRFSNDNPSTMYYGLIDKYVDMRLDVGITTDSYSTVNKTYEWIRQFTMAVDEWSGNDLDTITAELKDDSMFLQTIKPNPTMYENVTVAEIIWRLLDTLGYSNYFVEAIDADPSTLVPYFWTDGTKTMWEIIESLSQATQTAVYFDEYNVLQIKTRNTALNLSATPAWTFDGVVNGTKLPDIIDLTKNAAYEANVVNVAYRDTKPSDEVSGNAPMEVVWEPDGDVVLRSNALMSTINATQQYLRIDPVAAKVWPYSGIMQVEGEFIRYTAKSYSYYDKAGVLQSKYIKSNDEKVALDKLNPTLAFKNAFNGYFWLSERGALSSVGKAHYVDATGYFTRVKTGTGAQFSWPAGFRAVPGTSTAKITTNGTFKTNTWYTVTRGSEFDTAMNYYGARVRFPMSGYSFGAGGIVIAAGGSNEAGYYIELFRTALYTGNPAARNTTNEVSLYVKQPGATLKRFGPNNGRGTVLAVEKGKWYDIDVSVNWAASGGPSFTIYVNGVLQFTVQVPTAQIPSTGTTGRWGVFTRGYTAMDIEYVYGTNSGEQVSFDQANQYSRIHNGYISNQMFNEWVYNTRKVTRIIRKKKTSVIQRYNQLVIDDFGPMVQEVREYNVKFDTSGGDIGPSLHSRPYFSNVDQVICPEYTPNPFGAKFVLANTSRQNAIVNGEDQITYGADNSVTQKFFIYGRAIKQGEEKTETVRNENAILRHGEVVVDFSSDWIQSQAEAKALGEWITLHWAGGNDEITIESFMNPLLQLGDLVSINFPAGNMATSTHKYFIVEAKHSYDEGMSSSFTLRRARI